MYFLPPEDHYLKEPHVIDFTRVFSVRMDEKARVLKNKVLELDAAHRVELQEKLAYFYSREAAD